MKFHCPLCGTELKVEPQIEAIGTENMNDWSRSTLSITFVSKSVDHSCPKPLD